LTEVSDNRPTTSSKDDYENLDELVTPGNSNANSETVENAVEKPAQSVAETAT